MGAQDGLTAGLLARLAGALPKNTSPRSSQRRAWDAPEALEPRIMLDGDHPELPAPFNPAVGTVITIDGMSGQGTATGTISPPNGSNPDDDLFRFTVTTADFVTVLANTAGLNSTVNTAINVFNAAGNLVASGTNNGPLTSAAPDLAPDAWVGFIAQPGDYYVQVFSEGTTVGDYEVRVDTTTTDTEADIPLPDMDPQPDDTGEFTVEGNIGTLQGETIFFVDIPDDPAFESLATVVATTDPTLLDTRLEVYNSLGQLVAQDSDTGWLSSAYAAWMVSPGERFYIRVRSDETGMLFPSTGDFELVVDISAAELANPVSEVTRRGSSTNLLFDPFDTDLHRFVAQGTGLAFITVVDFTQEGGFAVHLYNDQGVQLAFDDDFVGTTPQIEIDLVGGETYYVVVQSFEPPPTPTPLQPAPYGLFIEAHHTSEEIGDVDDHEDLPAPNTPLDQARRQFGRATPLQWNEPRLQTDGDGNPIYDHSWVTDARGTGRINGPEDTDLFSFVAPVGMLGSYQGNNDDEGTALYVGGAFANADAGGIFVTNSAGLATWDAGDWWFTGPQGTEENPLGFLDNPDTPATDGPEIYALHAFSQTNSTGRPILIVGGDFSLQVNPDLILNNLAAWVFNPQAGTYQWFAVGAMTDGPVRAIAEYDPTEFDENGDEEGGEVDDPADNRLFIGGDFDNLVDPLDPNTTAATSNIAAFQLAPVPFDLTTFPINSLVGQWFVDPVGFDGPIHAFAVYDPEDPGEGREATDDLSEVADTPDPPISLFIGGDFTSAGGTPAANLAVFNGVEFSPANFGTPNTNGSVNGPVHALRVWDPPDPEDSESTLGQPVIIVAGEFTQAGGNPANNIAVYGRVANPVDGDDASDPEIEEYEPRLVFEALGAGTNGAIHALATITHIDDDGTENGEDIILGGAFTEAGGAEALRIALYDETDFPAPYSQPFGAGFDDTVFTLTVFADQQEPGLADDQLTLYAGGAFLNSGNDELNHAAQWDAANGVWVPLNTGTDGTVFVMLPYDDGNPNTWDRNDRPSSKIAITVSPTEGAFLNAFITIYDSQLNVIYTNETISPNPDPAGSVNPALGIGANDAFIIDELWAGETYYIEVRSSTQAFRNTGRYNITVTVDAIPVDVDEDGVLDDPIAVYNEEPDAGNWTGARRIIVDAAPGDTGQGDGTNRNNVENQPSVPVGPPTPPAAGSITRQFVYPRTPSPAIGATPSLFRPTEAYDYGTIESIDDTDLFFFRSTAAGYVEIRLNTTQIDQFYFERIWDFNDFPPTSEETLIPDDAPHVLSSRLQSIIRVFNNDQSEIGVSEFNPGVGGEDDTTTTGRFGDRTYTSRDARIVIPVQANRVYYVQIESAQKAIFDADPTLVDWRMATGAYELFIDAAPDFTPDNADDHANINERATPIPIGLDPDNAATNGRGSVVGEIRDVIANPDEPNDDRDRFFYYATGNGVVNITASAINSNVSLAITVTDDGGGTIATGLAPPGGSVNINWVAEQGNRFYIEVDGAGGTQGRYRIDVVGVPYVDDHADVGSWIDATTMTVNSFLGTAVATGSIEVLADSDLFVFTSDQHSIASVTVESFSATLNPTVRVYEILTDPAGNQFFGQIAFNDDTVLGPAGNTNSFARFSVTPTRNYYILVEGVNPNLDFGNYQVTVRVAPTDDHPNQASFPLSTALNPVVNPSGFAVATASGRIEVGADDDVFRFIAPAGGQATVTITRTDGDMDPLLRVLNSAGVEITGSPVGDTSTPGTVTFSFNVLRSQTYYLVVDLDVDGGTGSYTVDLQTPASDDHANQGEFTIATAVAISSTTGIGTTTGVINPSVDTDLFRFNARVVGNATITVTTPNSNLNPRIQIFDAAFNLISGSSDDTEQATQVVNATAVNQIFYVLVLSDSVGGGAQTGAYTFTVQQTIGGGGDPPPSGDDHANAGSFNNASPITLNANTGDGSIAGIVNFVGDTDLFRFTTPALNAGQSGNRPVFIQITSPNGGLVDGTLRVFRENPNTPGQFDLVASDNNGTPGNTASLRFDAPGNTTYYALVSPVGSSLGSYTLRVDTEPNTHFLYYPEGYSTSTIDEFVPVVNPNNFPVTYTVIARYEVGERDQFIVQNAVIPANSRGGFTVTSRNGTSLTRPDTPYALEIQSNGQLGATFAHYDFGVTTGESFTNRTSNNWTFAQVNRDGIADPNALGNIFNDYVLFYNPNNADTTVNVTLVYDDGTVNTFSRTVGAFRRSGINFDTDNALTRNGRFSVRLSSSAPIVAALSSYDIQNGRGYGLLGDPDAGATAGVIPNISTGNGVEASVALFNATNSAATITLVSSYTQTGLPDVTRTINLAANSRRTYTLTELGVVSGQPVGIRYSSNVAITMNAIEYRNGDGDAYSAGTFAGTTAIFGDAFVTPGGAGNTYIEQIGLYNPAGTSTTVAIRFLFADGTTSAPVNVTVGARRFALFQVDQAAAILNGPTPAFSIRLDSTTPFVASFTHYDLFLGGGWSTTGAIVGLTNALSTIS